MESINGRLFVGVGAVLCALKESQDVVVPRCATATVKVDQPRLDAIGRRSPSVLFDVFGSMDRECDPGGVLAGQAANEPVGQDGQAFDVGDRRLRVGSANLECAEPRM